MQDDDKKIKRDAFFEETYKALQLAREIAKDDAIRTGTGIVISQNGKVVTISAEELKRQRENKNS